jgi:energy-coupling factor transporter ATP-binding protein EcfA2
MEYMEKKYISDIINLNAVDNLEKGKQYLIIGGTGSGKTYWVKNTLLSNVIRKRKTMLLLVHRSRLKKQTIEDIQIVIKTMGMENDIKVIAYQKTDDFTQDYLDRFDYIVCDEAHYFVNDSWNNRTQDELEKIKNSKAAKIYMTATYETFLNLFEENELITIFKQEGIDDKISNKQKNIRCIYRTKSKDNFISKIKNNKNKSLVLFSSSKEAFKSSLMLDDSAFCCSESNKEYKQEIDKKCMEYLNKNKKFNRQILCSTTAIEGGVDLIDDELTLIAFQGYFNKDTLEQSAGRKRFHYEDDVLDFLVCEPTKLSISSRIRVLEKELSDMNKADEKGIESVLEERDDKFETPNWLRVENNTNLTTDNTKRIQKKAELIWLYDVYETGLTEYLANIHGIDKIIDIDAEQLELDILKKYLGKTMFKKYNDCIKQYIGEDEYMLQEEFKEFLKVIYGLRAENGSKKNSIGLNTINGFFDDKDIKYRLVPNNESARLLVEGIKKQFKLNYWTIESIS